MPTADLKFASLVGTTFDSILSPKKSPLAPEQGLVQLSELEAHVRALGCTTIAIETYYIDRDYIDDYSAFYAKNLLSHGNVCRRVHFFARPQAEVEAELDAQLVRDQQGSTAAFPAGVYLGFAVLKPLPGCPVGRTVVPPPQATEGLDSSFEPLCTDRVRLRGVELEVQGLAFQQQDLGVSACATTALWSSLHRAASFESFTRPTPAQITTLASQYLLPFGRSMPSEGLSVAQMCQAVQAIGLAPILIKTDNFAQARSLLRLAHSSAMAPVLIMKRGGEHHAVTLTGLQSSRERDPLLRVKDRPEQIVEPADLVVGLYVHDDRFKPYRHARLIDGGENSPPRVQLERGTNEDWELTHLLVPTHHKVRLSFAALHNMAMRAAKAALDCAQSVGFQSTISVDARIMRARDYVAALSRRSDVARETVVTLSTKIALSRYVAVIEIRSGEFDGFDLLLDTTSTWRSVAALAIVAAVQRTDRTALVASALADAYSSCPVVF